jgi:hypothetical protein
MADVPPPTESLFRRDGEHLVPQPIARGPWYDGTLHGSSMLAAMAWAAERHPSDVPRQVVRLTVDLMRAAPLAPLRTDVATVRSGKNLDILDLRLFADDELCVRASALRMRTADVVIGSPDPTGALPPRPPTDVEGDSESFFGGDSSDVRAFHHAIDVHTDAAHPEPLAWFRLKVPVVEGEVASGFVTVATLSDWTYAVPILVGRPRGDVDTAPDDERATFAINTDTTVSCFRPLVGEWVGLRTRSLVGDLGAGVSGAELFDAAGPLGFSSQSILVRGAAGSSVMIKEAG